MTCLQPLLGLDKSSPLIEILLDPSYPDKALVYFGTQLLETVHLGKDSVEAKLLAGRLYNAGFKRKTLTEEFGWDLKTIRGYGDALKEGCAKALARALCGQGAAVKIDAEKEQFIRQTFRQVYACEGCHSNSFICRELEEKLSCEVSHETVRRIINDERQIMQQEADSATHKREEVDADICSKEENDCSNDSSAASNLPENCNLSPSSPLPVLDLEQVVLLHHGGLFLVRALIDEVTKNVGPLRDLVRQWISAVLCGCVNIEQMGQLNYPSLELMLGPLQLKSVTAQRSALLEHASAELIAELRRSNLSFLNLELESLPLLYDPHGIEYTGQLKILKGWLGGSHRVGKAYYQDFIHTPDGRPMIAFLDDNRSTLLRRLPNNITELRRLAALPDEHPITLTVDRAVYSLDDLLDYRDRLHIYIITWEKNCTRPPWKPPAKDEVGCLYIPKPKNNSKDITVFKVEYYSLSWSRDPSVKQYIIRMHKGPDVPPITLSILSTCPDDFALPACAQIESILTRWVQENNIGYLIEHNGINEITSYQSYSYEEAADKLNLDEYLVHNPELRRLSTKKLTCRQKKAELLLAIEDRQNFYDQDQQRKDNELAGINRQLKEELSPEVSKASKRRRSSLRRSLKTLPDRRQAFLDKTNRKIADINDQIRSLNEKCQAEPKQVQRLEYLIANEYERLNFGPKALMDAIKLLAHNIHRQLHQQFRPIYDNYRNDHRVLRELIQSPAFLEETPDQYRVMLVPSRIDGNVAKAIMALIAQLPPIRTASGKPMVIEMHLPLQGIQLAI